MITYADVAETLRPEIREAIEVSAPCSESATRRHLWDHERSEIVNGWALLVRVDEWWHCVYCGVHATKNPVPVEERDLHLRLLGPEADEPWWGAA